VIEELVRELERYGVEYELLSHRHTLTAGDEAAALGVPRGQVAKTLVLWTGGGGYVRAVLPASDRLALGKVRELLGEGKATRLATEEELAGAYPMFELGAVPPFGGPTGDRAIVDSRLAELDSVVIEAGSHSESVRIRTDDLVSLTGAELADICED
jgi:Ala-tRNA(Pro) deacylase